MLSSLKWPRPKFSPLDCRTTSLHQTLCGDPLDQDFSSLAWENLKFNKSKKPDSPSSFSSSPDRNPNNIQCFSVQVIIANDRFELLPSVFNILVEGASSAIFFEDGPVVYPANAFDCCLRGDKVPLGSSATKSQKKY